MKFIVQGLIKAFWMLVTLDPEVVRITLLTLKVTITATIISVLVGIPLGTFLALRLFRGRNLIVTLVNAGMGMPPVLVGLWVSLFLWRYGPLGFLNAMYTPTAIVIAQGIIASPLVTGFTIAAIQQINPRLRLQILALGASRWQMLVLLLREARLALLAGIIAGFGGVISEVGAAMMVGGNIKGLTRILTTAMALEVSKGQFDLAIALSFILLALIIGITLGLTLIQQRGHASS
ncbi:MAG TPA: ABC transporter permease [Clostridia bacterium]|nr:ABC transporter permease [Clostridia bacterium]